MIGKGMNRFLGLYRETGVYQLLLYRLGLLLVLFSVQRVAFYLYNQSLFEGVSFFGFLYMLYGGVQFDVTAILYFNLLYIVLLLLPFKFRTNKLYQKSLDGLFLVSNIGALVMNSADVIYYRFTLRRTTFSVLNEFGNETGHLLKIISQFLITYWYVGLYTIVMMVGFIVATKYIKTKEANVSWRLRDYMMSSVMLVAAILLSVIGIRGGVGKHVRPITLSNASKYVGRINERAIVLNTPFSFFRSMEAEGFKKVSYFSEEELEEVYTPVHVPGKSVFKPLNVVVIIWESFGKEYTGFYNRHLDEGRYKGYTPFVDSLLGKSVVNYHSFANGRKSIDAMPSIFASVPSLQEPFVLSHYSGNNIKSLPALLKEKGYYSAFFHGAPNGSMGFDAFARQAGFDDYFGKDEYGNDEDFDGTWGIWDEEFLQFFAKKMDGFKEPFLTSVFTVSSHDPFKLPEKYEGQFPEGPGPIHHSIGYTDYALKRFFEEASKMSWFENTLFVVTADHASTSYESTYKTMVGGFSIPVFFYLPGDASSAVMRDGLVQQIDIMPTVLGKLGYGESYLAFGQNVFEKGDESFVVNFRDGVYQLFYKDYMIQFSEKQEKVVGVYLYKEDLLMKNNLARDKNELVEGLEKKVKAFIQQYNNRMISNDLVVE